MLVDLRYDFLVFSLPRGNPMIENYTRRECEWNKEIIPTTRHTPKGHIQPYDLLQNHNRLYIFKKNFFFCFFIKVVLYIYILKYIENIFFRIIKIYSSCLEKLWKKKLIQVVILRANILLNFHQSKLALVFYQTVFFLNIYQRYYSTIL